MSLSSFSGSGPGLLFRIPDEGYEYVVTLAVIAPTLVIAGPGSISIDAVVGVDESLSGAVGAGILGGGILAAVGQLATFWRRPGSDEATG